MAFFQTCVAFFPAGTRGMVTCGCAVALLSITAQAADRSAYFEGELKIAPIARFDDLPTRFYLQPEFEVITAERYLSEDVVLFFARMLEGNYDSEIQLQAAQSLQRVAREKLADAELFVPALRKRLLSTESRFVRRACGLALAEADSVADADLLAGLCDSSDEVVCSSIEPKLAAWKSESLQATWEKRVRNPETTSRRMMSLACNGLAALNAVSMAPDLQKLVASDRNSFTARSAAAEALSTIAPQESFEAATALAQAGTQGRILAAALLKSAKSNESLELLSVLCDDQEHAVASIAWDQMWRQDVDRLLPRIADAIQHLDPRVRSVVVKVVLQRPTEEHCDLLYRLLGDAHIGVRNEAREALQKLAKSDAALKTHICANAGATIQNSNSVWQQIEQSLLLIGDLRHDAWQADCLPLLQHSRPEVMVTAAWLLHLMPDSATGEVAAKEAQRRFGLLNERKVANEDFIAVDEQVTYLLFVGGLTQQSQLKPLCAELFDKSAPLSSDGRAAGLWTLGLLSTGSKDESLASKFTERIFDDNPFFPEAEIVKCASALALGMVGRPDSIPPLRRAHKTYGTGQYLGNCVATSLRMLGEDVPVVSEPSMEAIGDWPLFPTGTLKGPPAEPNAQASEEAGKP